MYAPPDTNINRKIKNVHGGVRSQDESQPQCPSGGIIRHSGTEEAMCEQQVNDILKCAPDGINQFRRRLAIEDRPSDRNVGCSFEFSVRTLAFLFR